MREGIGALLALLAMGLLAVSIVALIHPLKTIKLGSRKRAGAALGGSFGLFILAGIVMPSPTPEELAEMERAAAETEKLETERAAAEAERLKPQITAAARMLWTNVTTQVGRCDEAGAAVADYVGSRGANIYDAYQIVQQAENLCSSSATRVSDIDVPDAIPSEARGSFREAITTCRDAYYAKSSAYGQMARVIDGDARPSAVAEARDAATRSQAGQMLCALGFMEAASEAGLDVGEVLGEEFPEQPEAS